MDTDRFTWNHKQHASHFPKLFENIANNEKKKDAEKQARIEQGKNDKLYGEDDEIR